jgi:hypothetical protein
MNKEEYNRQQRCQKDMIESIVRGNSQQEKEKTLELLCESIDKLEKMAKDLAEITQALKRVCLA